MRSAWKTIYLYVPTTSEPRLVAHLANRRRHHFDAPIRAVGTGRWIVHGWFPTRSPQGANEYPTPTNFADGPRLDKYFTSKVRGSNHRTLGESRPAGKYLRSTRETTIKQPSPDYFTTPPPRPPPPSLHPRSSHVFRSDTVPQMSLTA